MARHEPNVITERKQALANRSNQRCMIAPGKIGAPDRTLKQNIADNREPTRRMEENHVPRRMARAMDDLKVELAHLDAIAPFEPAIGGKSLQARKAKHRALGGQLIDPKCIVPMGPLNGNAVSMRKLGSLTTMVDMAVGEENLHQLAATGFESGVDCIEIAARIDNRGCAGTTTNEQRTVLRERRDGDDGELQGGRRRAVC